MLERMLEVTRKAYWTLDENTLKSLMSAFYDLYRVEDDKILEHWDVIEPIPELEKRKNANGKF